MSSYPDMYNPPQSQQLIQRCVIVQKDERGYGLTVTGDNPVFIQSVKDHGAAYRAGVQTGDRIIKVNGTLVTQSNHVEVVKMIKSGSFVALTLLGKPPGPLTTSPQPTGPTPGITRNSKSRQTVTQPLPVSSQQDVAVKSERLNTFKRMLEQERALLDHTEHEYSLNPSEKLLKDINGIKTRISVLEKQLQKAANSMLQAKVGGSNQALTPVPPPGGSDTISEGQVADSNAALPSDHTNMNEEFQTIPEELPHGVSHARQRSSPETFSQAPSQSPDRLQAASAGLKRNNSDAQAKEAARQRYRNENPAAAMEPLTRGKKQRKDFELGRTQSLPGDPMDPSFEEVDDNSSGSASPTKMVNMESVTPMEGVEEANVISADARVSDPSLPQIHMATVNTVEVYSAPTVHPEVHPVQGPGVPLAQGQGQKPIMCMDEDDFQSDNEAFEEHGPFNDIDQLEKKHAHMAVFLHYLISNSDPSTLFFYLVTDSYAKGNLKEMKKWVYDIFSTFLGNQGPLRIQMSENIVSAIERTINTQLGHEDAMRNVFLTARSEAKEEVEELLADFRQKRALGLGSIFGDQHLTNEDMDRNQELKIVESTLLPHLDRLTTYEAEKEPKNQALAASLTTFMKQAGVKYQSNSALERAPSFMNKDKRGPLKFPRSTKKQSVKGHMFQENQFLNATFCNQCNGLLWGIGCQGLQCIYCDFTLHKSGPCLEQITMECSGKKKKDRHKRKTTLLSNSVSGQTPTSPQPVVVQMKKDNDELAHAKQEQNAQLSKDIDVGTMVDQFENKEGLSTGRSSVTDSGLGFMSSTDSTPGSVPHADDHKPDVSDQGKKRIFIKRSASLKSKGEEKKEGRRTNDNKRSRSDVDMDGQSVAAVLSPSQASSSSSLSTKSQDSPRASLEQLARMEEDDSDMESEATTPNWQKLIDKDIIKKLKPKEVKRQEVINELFHTEKTHVRALKVLRRVFFLPMLEEEILPRETVYFIFPNIDEMIEIHGALNEAMKKDRRTSQIIQEVSQILLDRFDGEAGETMKRVCATFCQNQSTAMEHLKKLIRKDKERDNRKEGSITRFMEEAEANPLCRRLPLPGIVATGYQRLTKYPLLIENMLKYTPPKSPEHERLQLALEKSKEILSSVNQAVKECENRFRLMDYNSRMDRTPLDKSNNALVVDYKNFDLQSYKMIHDGNLTWKVNRNKSIEVQVLLLEELIVILTKQDDKLILKLHSTLNQAREESKTHSPIIKLSNVLCRPVATNRKAFFLVSTASAAGPQIYELVAQSQQDRQSWMDVVHATQETERRQAKGGRRNARSAVTARPPMIPPDLHPVREESIKKEDNPEINEPPEVVSNDAVLAPEPEVVTLGAVSESRSEAEPVGDIRTALQNTIEQEPGEEATTLERFQYLSLLTNRIKSVLDEAVGDPSDKKLLSEANGLIAKVVTLLSEQSVKREVELTRAQQENQTLHSDRVDIMAAQQRLTSELSMTQHELDGLQTDRLQTQGTGAGSVDSILSAGPDDRLMVATAAEKQNNRQSYSGDSSAAESEDSKTVESSENEDTTVVQDEEVRSLNDSDAPPTPNEVTAAAAELEIFQADPQMVKPVVNEQLLELQSIATGQNEGGRTGGTEGEGEGEGGEDAPLGHVIADQEREDIVNGAADLKVDDSLEDANYHGDNDDDDEDRDDNDRNVSNGFNAERGKEETQPDLLDSSAVVSPVDINSNPENVPELTTGEVISIPEQDKPDLASLNGNLLQINADGGLGDGDAVPATYDANSAPSNDILDDTDAPYPPTTKEGSSPEPCVIQVVDPGQSQAGDLISNVETTTLDEGGLELGPDGGKTGLGTTEDKADVIQTTDSLVPEPSQVESIEGSSRPASIISVDSASSDVMISSQSDEKDEKEEVKKPESSSSQEMLTKGPIIQETEAEMV